MGVNVILRGMIAIFAIGIVFLSLTPYIDDLATNSSLWGDVIDERAIFLRDNALTLFYVIGLIAFFTVIIWMFNASSRKGATVGYD